jgi:hypothetical protein
MDQLFKLGKDLIKGGGRPQHGNHSGYPPNQGGYYPSPQEQGPYMNNGGYGYGPGPAQPGYGYPPQQGYGGHHGGGMNPLAKLKMFDRDGDGMINILNEFKRDIFI